MTTSAPTVGTARPRSVRGDDTATVGAQNRRKDDSRIEPLRDEYVAPVEGGAKAILTRISRSPGTGCATSSTRRFSGPPISCSTTARIARGFADGRDAPAGMEIDPVRILRASKLRVGTFRAQGPPAILLSVAAVVMAFGAARSLMVATPALPETLREAKNLLESTRREPRPLQP